MHPRLINVATDDVHLSVDFADGRRVVVPLALFPQLLHASADQRRNWRFVDEAQAIYWPEVDEFLSVSRLLHHNVVSEPRPSSRASPHKKRAGATLIGGVLAVVLALFLFFQDRGSRLARRAGIGDAPELVRGLNVSRAAVQEAFAQFPLSVTFEPTTAVDDQPRVTGQTPDGLAMIELIGPADNLTQLGCLIGLPNDSTPRLIAQNAAVAMVLLKKGVPTWSEGMDWLQKAVKQATSTGEAHIETHGARISIRYASVGMMTLTIKALEARPSPPHPQKPSVSSSLTIPSDVTYTIINATMIPGIKRSLDVRLSRKVEGDVLRSIAMNLRSADPKQYERTFIVYYLPDMQVGSRGWATTHFNPDLKVNILGLTVEDETKLVAQPEPGNREIIGRWLDESFGRRITIFREEGKLFIEQTFKDGSSGTDQLTESKSSLGRRFDEVRTQLADVSVRNRPSGPASAGRQFVQTKLLELDSFKSEPKFHQFGFAIGGPFNSWLKSVESKRNDPGFILFESVAVGDLQMLGLEYMRTKGHENDYTRYARKQITQVIQEGAPEADTGDHWVLDARGDLQIRDNEGLIATAKKIK